ncbi:MAG: CBM9 family sugar-binding protein [Pontiellaceae bacterium]|jgi:hypothetical protein|nr:CBM9 family sugar-binding protein [Pontiellaceae bacterium]
MKTQIFFLTFALLFTGTVPAETGNPKDIPNAGRIRIDGRLDDWRTAGWTPLTQPLHGNPSSISNAQWSIQWDDKPSLFIAVSYDDADLIFQDSYVSSNAQDCVNIFVRGDNGSQPADYSERQDSAQQYIFGLAKDKTSAWKKLARIDPFPLHNPAKAAITVNSNRLTYEISIPLYDTFDAEFRRKCRTTEVMEDLEIGVDITIINVTSNGYAGTLAENLMPDKEHNAGHIALHTLGE